MLDVVPAIASRLTAKLGAGWAVTTGLQPADRTVFPRVDVRLQGASLERVSGPSVILAPRYVVTVVAQSTEADWAALDAAITAVIASVHHWKPVGHEARLVLSHLIEMEMLDQVLLGYELAFTMTTPRIGSNE